MSIWRNNEELQIIEGHRLKKVVWKSKLSNGFEEVAGFTGGLPLHENLLRLYYI